MNQILAQKQNVRILMVKDKIKIKINVKKEEWEKRNRNGRELLVDAATRRLERQLKLCKNVKIESFLFILK